MTRQSRRLEPLASIDNRALVVRAHQMRVDAWAAEAIVALNGAGVECLLLKGPVTARWLYQDDPTQRPYVDVDLLIAPGQAEQAHHVLVRLGYAPQAAAMPPGDLPHARPYQRASDRANVDLHRVPNGMRTVPERRAWATMTREAETLSVAGVTVTAPGAVARTLLLALHISPRNDALSRAGRDLRRAGTLVPHSTWHQAAVLARSLGLEREMGHRLWVISETRDLAERLALPRGETASYARFRTAQSDHPRGTLSLLTVSEYATVRERLRYVAVKLYPPPVVLADRDPLARRGRGGVIAARLRWQWHCARWLPAAVRAWRAQRPRAVR
jgi:hypothetical protein